MSELEGAADRLQAELAERLAPWLVDRSVGLWEAWAHRSAAPAMRVDLTAAAAVASERVLRDLEALMERDIDEQWTSPLDLVRRGVAPMTDVLRAAGVPPVVRDEFDERHFPDDCYGFAPAAWADIDDALTEPGLVWGAAKARAHLLARAGRDARAGGAPPNAGPSDVVAFAPDLIDQSRLRAAGVVRFVRTPDQLTDEDAGLVLVDLSRSGVLDVVGRLGARVVGFVPHVDEELARSAVAAGCDEVLPRSVFFRRIGRLLAGPGRPEDKMSP